MAKKKERGNGDGDVWPRKNKEGKVIGYRASYWVETAEGPKRRYVSGKNKGETRVALSKVRREGRTASPITAYYGRFPPLHSCPTSASPAATGASTGLRPSISRASERG